MSTKSFRPTGLRTPTRRHRRSITAIEGGLALAALGGGVMLVLDRNTPSVSALEPLGLTSWALPGVWLLASVAVPSAVAATLAWRRSPTTPRAVLLASGLLGVELLVQIPFVGPSGLQAAMALVGGTAAGLAWHGRDTW